VSKLLTAVTLASALSLGFKAEASTLYSSRLIFLASLGTTVTDDYENPAYTTHMSDATMNAVLNETVYQTTGFANNDQVFPFGSGNHIYCAGCNGSFLLTFTSTTVGNASGVFGVGLDVVDINNGYTAFVTFGDNSTANFALPPVGSFWGITDPVSIKSIAFGLPNGGTTTDISFAMDNLTIGSGVPEPTAFSLMGAGLALLVAKRLRRARSR
jgi:hypothetical protein